MSTKYISGPTREILVTAGGAVLIDAVVVVNEVIGIAITGAAASGDEYRLGIRGLWEFPLTAATVLAAGEVCYWSGTAAIDTASGNETLGIVERNAASGDATVRVQLGQAVVNVPA